MFPLKIACNELISSKKKSYMKQYKRDIHQEPQRKATEKVIEQFMTVGYASPSRQHPILEQS